MKKQRLFHSKNSTPYWSVLTHDTEHKTALKPNNFMSVLQAQYKTHPGTGSVLDAKEATPVQHL